MDVNIASLVPNENLTIDQGAVAPWRTLMWSLMTDVCRAMGVRTDVPFKDLSEKEKDIVYNGKPEKKHIFYKSKTTNVAGEMDFTYYSAIYTVKNALSKVKDEKGMKRVEKFLKEDLCPECGGTRLSAAARSALYSCLSRLFPSGLMLLPIARILRSSTSRRIRLQLTPMLSTG